MGFYSLFSALEDKEETVLGAALGFRIHSAVLGQWLST